jgi:hypothetical protein
MYHSNIRRRNDGGAMNTQKSSLSVVLLAAVFGIVLLFLAVPSQAQNAQVDLTTACNGASCFNWAGIFADGVTFLGLPGMDNGNNCTVSGYSNCPDAYSSNQMGLSSATSPTLTPASLGIPFTFGPVSTANCGPSTSPVVNCSQDMINIPTGGITITLSSSQQQAPFSTMVMLGTSVNGFHGQHAGVVTVNYTTGAPQTFNQKFSDWCGPQGNQYESIAVGQMERINMSGALNGPGSCNLYAYTYPLDVSRNVQSVNLTETDTFDETYALAITFKPPSYAIEGGVASPASVGAGASATATITVAPQPGYNGTVNLSCSISPAIVGDPVSAATPPTCSLSPASVAVSTNGTPPPPPPTTTLTFTAASASSSSSMSMRPPHIFYAFLIVPGVVLTGFGFGSRGSRRKRLFGLMLLGLVLIGVVGMPACVSYTHLGNVGTPPGQYTVAITGVDDNGLTQASNPAGTTNTVVVTVTQSN